MQRSEQIRQLFDAALEIAPDLRADFVRQQCADDAALGAEVLQLLLMDQQSLSVFNQGVAPLNPMPKPFPKIAGLDLLEVIGEGGMGVVYRARQKIPFVREVAVKVIKPGMDSRAVLVRFEAERQALAMMNHPNIAQVFDAGLTDEDRPYFVMEYVAGVAITDYCDINRLKTRDRLELFLGACEAIEHAHRKSIIHRDLKPANILVFLPPGETAPRVKVIDFGVAKALNRSLTERTIFTEHGQMVGTPEYMSPEQAEMTALDVDHRSDVYSLGVLLYELLVGALPFVLRRVAAEAMRRTIRNSTPQKPSTRLSTLDERSTEISSRRQTDPRTLMRQLRGDLDDITMTALEKDRAHRYQSAADFAADIRRHLRGDSIIAKPPPLSRRLSRSVRKHLAWYTVAAILIVAVSGTAWFQARQSKISAKEHALAEARRAYDDNPMRAGPLYASIIATDPRDTDALRNSGSDRIEQFVTQRATERNHELLTEAIGLCDAAIAVDNHDVRAWNIKGNALLLAGRHSDSQAALLQAIKIDPNFPWAHSNLAKSLAPQGRIPEALTAAIVATDGLSGKTQIAGTYRVMLLLNRSVLERATGRRASATETLRLARESKKDDPRPMMVQAWWELLDSESAHNASELAGAAVRIAERPDPRLRRVLALAYLREQNWESAIVNAQLALELGDAPLYPNSIKAIALARQWKMDAARQSLMDAEMTWPIADQDGQGLWVNVDFDYVWIDRAVEAVAIRDEASTAVGVGR